jgi:hypothetical protein
LPAFWPFPHFKLKSRVLFSPPQADEAGEPFDDAKKQHRLRRTICRGWRNKQWHGRLLAFVELLSGDAPVIALPLSETACVRLEAAQFCSSLPSVLIFQAGWDMRTRRRIVRHSAVLNLRRTSNGFP